jgi:putative phage-type endonuclease
MAELIKFESRSQWLEVRKGGIGGSDAAAVLGMSPWCSPLDVWLDKTGRAKPVDETPAMYWGTQLEDLVAKEYANQSGRKVQRVNSVLKDPEGLPLLASIDRVVCPQDGKAPVVKGEFRTDKILECKTAGQYASDNWGEPGTDDVPRYYLCQCLHYLGITGVDMCDVAVLIGGRDFRMYTIRHDRETVAIMRERLAQWWRDHVVADVAPEPRTGAEALALYPSSTGDRVIASAEVEQAAKELAELKGKAKQLKEEVEKREDAIKCAIGGAEALAGVTGDIIATWKSAKGSAKTDWQAVANELNAPAEVVSRHTMETAGSRRLLLKIKTERGA